MARSFTALFAMLSAASAIAAAATIPGDFFADAIPVSGPVWSWQGVLGRASHEPGEPIHVLLPEHSHTYWFQWTAPASGILGLLMENGLGQDTFENYTDNVGAGAAFYGAVVYQTTGGLQGLQRLAGPGRSLEIAGATEVTVQAGATYYVVLDGLALDTQTTLQAFLRPADAPAHDHFASAATLPAVSPEVFTSLAGATLEKGEPAFGTWLEPVLGPNTYGFLDRFLMPAKRGGQSVWYRWEPPTTGRFAAEAWFPNNIPLLAVYRSRTATPDWNSLDRIASVTNGVNINRTYPPTNPGDPPFIQSIIQRSTRVQCDFDATAGETLWIQLDQLAPIGVPPTDFDWTPMRLTGTNSMGRLRIWEPAPSYDSFSHPATVTVHEEKFVTVPFASLEPSEPPMPSGANGSIWWRWTAFQDVGVELESPLPLDAWVGESIQTLQPVTLQILTSNTVFRARFQATAGVTYRFRTARNGFSLSSLLLATECPQNRIDGAAKISSDGRGALLSAGYSSVESGEPAPRNPSSGVLWCQWDPPKTGIYEFKNPGAIDRSSFFHRTPEGLLEEIPSSEGWVEIRQLRTVWIALENVHRIQPGRVVLGPSPFESNDDFAKATHIPLPPAGTAWFEAPFRASTEPGEPSHGSSPAHASLWYEFTVPESESWEIELTALEHCEAALYEGQNLGALHPRGTWLEKSGRVEPGKRVMRFDGAAGERLRLALDVTALPQTALIPLQVMFRIVPAVPNDLPAQALTLPQGPLKGTTRGYVTEDEPLPDWHPVGSSVWYRAELPADSPGWLRMFPAGRSPDGWIPQLRVFTQETSGAWTLVGQSAMTTGLSPVIATLEPGRSSSSLWIQVLTPPGPPLEFTLELIPGLLPMAPMPDARRLRAGTNTIWFRGYPTWAARLEQSQDLKTWSPAGDFILGEENVGVRVPDITPGSPKFFRGRPLPSTVLAAPVPNP
ncbi:MAG: hypothetical protein JNL10_01355 [Verrucomicrobiales bacterium]|nr:hypothetical protein [Verrucomicrobiales bacterium]